MIERWNYPGGEVGIRVVDELRETLWRIQSSDDLVALVMAHSVAQYQRVFIPYLPYARQDRVAVPGDPVAIDVLASMLSDIPVIHALDAHSSRAAKAFRGVGVDFVNLSPVNYLRKYLSEVVGDAPVVLVAPDAGSVKKVQGYSELLRLGAPIECSKLRDANTGKLAGFRVTRMPEIPWNAHLVIADDICDGGGTFQGVYKEVREAVERGHPFHLWTTHGIYSKGLVPLTDLFDTVGSTNSFLHPHSHERLVTVPL
jgi:ribose-phosphate pyrophosphokinase